MNECTSGQNVEPKTDFQADAMSSFSHWLKFSLPWFDWWRALYSKHQFENLPKAGYSGQNFRLKNFTVCLTDCISKNASSNFLTGPWVERIYVRIWLRYWVWWHFVVTSVTILLLFFIEIVTICYENVTLVVKSTWYVISRWCSMRLKFYKELFSIQHIQYYKCLSININNVIYTKNWQAFSLKYLFYFKIKTRFLWTSVREKSTDWISDSVREL